jgi:hypothetical protein
MHALFGLPHEGSVEALFVRQEYKNGIMGSLQRMKMLLLINDLSH